MLDLPFIRRAILLADPAQPQARTAAVAALGPRKLRQSPKIALSDRTNAHAPPRFRSRAPRPVRASAALQSRCSAAQPADAQRLGLRAGYGVPGRWIRATPSAPSRTARH